MNTPRTNNSINLEKAKNLLNSINHELEDGIDDDLVEFKPDEKFWRDITSQYPNAMAAYDSFKTDSNAHLFIIVVRERADVKIYYFTKQNSTPVTITKIESIIAVFTLRNGIKPKWDKLGDNIINQRENAVKDSGIRFYDYLLMGYLFSIDAVGLEECFGAKSVSCSKELKKKFKTNKFLLYEKCSITPKKKDEWELRDEESTYRVKKDGGKLNIYLISKKKKLNSYLRCKRVLPNECDSMCGVWIYCDNELIKPLWEWIYTNEGVFWGDMLQIVRIPENCEFNNLPPNIHHLKIKRIALLRGKGKKCLQSATEDSTCLYLRTRSQPVEKDLKNSNELMDLNSFEHIHVVADAEDTDDILSNFDIAKRKRNNRSDSEANDREFVFLNIFSSKSPGSTCNLGLKLIDLIPANTRISTSLNVSVDFAPKFTKYFFESLIKEKSVVKAATKAREKIKNEIGADKNFWRFAYIVEGYPCTDVSWATV